MNDDTMNQVYLLAQEHCGLKVGDWVRVTRKAENYEAGWDNCWVNDDIDRNKTYLLCNISERGVYLDCGKYGLRVFPYFVLEKVEKPEHEFKSFDKVLVREGKNDLWKPDIFFFWSNYFCCTRGNWSYCIPYEGNEHLVGTTNEPEE